MAGREAQIPQVDPNEPPQPEPIPPSLRILMVLSEALRTSCNFMADHCQQNQDAMDQLAVNEQILEIAEPAIQNSLLRLENERTTDAP